MEKIFGVKGIAGEEVRFVIAGSCEDYRPHTMVAPRSSSRLGAGVDSGGCITHHTGIAAGVTLSFSYETTKELGDNVRVIITVADPSRHQIPRDFLKEVLPEFSMVSLDIAGRGWTQERDGEQMAQILFRSDSKPLSPEARALSQPAGISRPLPRPALVHAAADIADLPTDPTFRPDPLPDPQEAERILVGDEEIEPIEEEEDREEPTVHRPEDNE